MSKMGCQVALQGPVPVEFGQVFPDGAYAAGGFEPVRDFDASSNGRFVQSKDMGHDSTRAALIYLQSSAERQRAIADQVGKNAKAALGKSTRSGQEAIKTR
jgi:hypothetical protein